MGEGAQAATRALELLGHVGDQPGGARLSELAAATGLAVPTAHRLLRALVDTGFAVQEPSSRRYGLGPRITALARQTGRIERLRLAVRPILEQFQRDTAETVFVSCLEGDEVVIVDCIVADAALQLGGRPGIRLPLHATSQGKAILAFMRPDDVERILTRLALPKLTRSTIDDLDDLRRELRRVRARGYAINDQERESGIRSLAAPILDRSGHAFGAICVGAPAPRWRMGALAERFAPALKAAAAEMSRRAVASEGAP